MSDNPEDFPFYPYQRLHKLMQRFYKDWPTLHSEKDSKEMHEEARELLAQTTRSQTTVFDALCRLRTAKCLGLDRWRRLGDAGHTVAWKEGWLDADTNATLPPASPAGSEADEMDEEGKFPYKDLR